MANASRRIFLTIAYLFACVTVAAQTPDECRPLSPDAARLVEIRSGYYYVDGGLAEFDPCHASVKLSMPSFWADKLADKPPLMIIAHGGGGPSPAELEMVRRLNARGVATLLFDAYEINGFRYKGTMLFALGVTNESRQRMIFKATLGAYEWARKLQNVDTTRMYINGLSNGGSVAINMAAVVDPHHVRMVFAEGATPTGIGMPDVIKVPLRLVYGRLDNYGGKTPDDWMYSRTDPCHFNRPSPLAAPGTAMRCNPLANRAEMTIPVQVWGEGLASKGSPINFWFYDNAAHGLLAGPLKREMRVYGTGSTAMTRYGWTGGNSDDANRFTKDLVEEIKISYR